MLLDGLTEEEFADVVAEEVVADDLCRRKRMSVRHLLRLLSST